MMGHAECTPIELKFFTALHSQSEKNDGAIRSDDDETVDGPK